MPGVELGNCADAIIANVHDDGMSPDQLGSDIQSIAMLWRAFTTPVDRNLPDLTYGDLIATTNLHVAYEVEDQPNDQFKVTWKISTTPGGAAARRETTMLPSLCSPYGLPLICSCAGCGAERSRATATNKEWQ